MYQHVLVVLGDGGAEERALPWLRRLLSGHETTVRERPRLLPGGRGVASDPGGALRLARGRLVGVLTRDELAAAQPSPATTLAVGEIHGWLAAIAVDEIMRA